MQISSGAIRPFGPVDVLYIDDDSSWREPTCDFLREEGFSVEGVADGAAALAYLECGHHPSLVFLDLDMPGMNGLEFLARVRKNPSTAEIPIVVVSGLVRSGVLAGQHGVVPYVSKPVDVQSLVTYARRLSKRRGSSTGH